MSHYPLHLITDNRIEKLPDLISEVVSGCISIIQLRNKHADKLVLYEVGKKILKILKPKKIPLIINDHIDLALALDADGVHIGQTDLPYNQARKILGKNKIIGLSIQTLEHAKKAEKYYADYFGVGPVFHTNTKSDAFTLGVNQFQEITQLLKKPCIAIGGIKIADVKTILSHGAQGIAVVSGICAAANPRLATINYIKELSNA